VGGILKKARPLQEVFADWKVKKTSFFMRKKKKKKKEKKHQQLSLRGRAESTT